MNRVVFLGTSRCLPTDRRDNTSILFETDDDAILVDCSGKPYQKLLNCGANLENLDSIIITHFHVDHCYGVPSLLNSLWLAGRQRMLSVLGLPVVIEKVVALLTIFDFPDGWDAMMKMYPVEFRKASDRFGSNIYDGPGLAVSSCVNSHMIPNLSLKVQFKRIGKTVVYTSDTAAPNSDIVRLAQGTDWLIHETNFLSGMEEEAAKVGHSTAAQVGQMARQTHARSLVLVHHGLDSASDLKRMKEQVGPGRFTVSIPSDMESVDIE